MGAKDSSVHGCYSNPKLIKKFYYFTSGILKLLRVKL